MCVCRTVVTVLRAAENDGKCGDMELLGGTLFIYSRLLRVEHQELRKTMCTFMKINDFL